jgi:hypothetical protein
MKTSTKIVDVSDIEQSHLRQLNSLMLTQKVSLDRFRLCRLILHNAVLRAHGSIGASPSWPNALRSA